MSRAKLRKSRPGSADPADLHRRQLPEARLSGRGPRAGHAQRDHASELDRLERKATEFWVRIQEELGLDVLVDGEQYRGDMVAYFAETMPGFAKGGLVRSYGNRYYHKPVMVGPVRWPGPMTVDWWRWTQSLTTRPVKGMLTGPVHAHGLVVRRPLSGPRSGLPRARPRGPEGGRGAPRGRGPDHPDRRARALGPARRAGLRRRGDAPRGRRPAGLLRRPRVLRRLRDDLSGPSRPAGRQPRSRDLAQRPRPPGECSRRTRSPRISRSGCSTSTATPWRRPTTSKGASAAAPPSCRPTGSGSIPTAASRPAPWRRAARSSSAMMAAVRAARAELG